MVVESDTRRCVGFPVGVSFSGVLSLVGGIDVVATVGILVGIGNAEPDIGNTLERVLSQLRVSGRTANVVYAKKTVALWIGQKCLPWDKSVFCRLDGTILSQPSCFGTN